MATAPGAIVAGHRIPLPATDFYLALATVALFLPAVVIVHRTLAAVVRLVTRVKPHRS